MQVFVVMVNIYDGDMDDFIFEEVYVVYIVIVVEYVGKMNRFGYCVVEFDYGLLFIYFGDKMISYG